MFHFERRHEPVAAQHVFASRVVSNLVVACAMPVGTAGLGTWGLMVFEGQMFDQGLHNAARIICGLDPVPAALNVSEEWFEIAHRLLSSLVVVIATGIFLVPILHRIMHRFHVGADGKLDGSAK